MTLRKAAFWGGFALLLGVSVWTVAPDPARLAAGLPRLIEAMEARAYGRDLIEKIAFRNWIGLLERTIG